MAQQAGEAGRQCGCSLHPVQKPFTGRNKAIKAINLHINKPFSLSNAPTSTQAWQGEQEGEMCASLALSPGLILFL